MDRVTRLRDELLAHADPVRAAKQQKHQRSELPFLGLGIADVRRIVRAVAKDTPYEEVGALRADAFRLWREATHREHRYAAIELTGLKVAQDRPELLDLYLEVIETGQGLDYMDEIAPRIGDLLLADRERMTPLIEGWSDSDDLWLRWVSIACQVGHKRRTDQELLTTCIDANLADPDYAIRKAIGRVLRDYARKEPDWVRAFVAEREDTLSDVSRQEALKHLS